MPFSCRLPECYSICYKFFEFYINIFLRSSYINCLVLSIISLGLFLYLYIIQSKYTRVLLILFSLIILLLALIFLNTSLIIILVNVSKYYTIEFIIDHYYVHILSDPQSLNFYNQYIYDSNYNNINFYLRKYSFNYAYICICIHFFFIINYIILLCQLIMIFYNYYNYHVIEDK